MGEKIAKRKAGLGLLLGLAGVLGAGGAEVIHVQGPKTVVGFVEESKGKLEDVLGIDLRLTAEGGSRHAVDAVGENRVEVGVITRMLSENERAEFPSLPLEGKLIARQVLVWVVSEDVWRSGVRALSREQLRGIYEQRVVNWKELGGEDRGIQFFNPAQGSGVWEQLALWLYEEQQKAPLGRFPKAATPQEAMEALATVRGGLSLVPLAVAEGASVHVLGIQIKEGSVAEADAASIASGRYPMQRPVVLVARRRAAGALKKFLDYFGSEAGREMLRASGLVPASN